MTVRELIHNALRLIGVVASGENATASEAEDSLVALNDMLDAWTTQRLAVWAITRTTHSLVASQQTYTLGASGDFNQVRPVFLDRITLIQPGSIEVSLRMLSAKQWALDIPDKTVTSSQPTDVYVDGAYPLRSCSFWPIPTGSGLSVAIYAPDEVSAFANLDATVAMPPGYAEALRYNLAVRLATEFARPIDPMIIQIANRALSQIKTANTEEHTQTLDVDPFLRGSGGRFDWRTGEMR